MKALILGNMPEDSEQEFEDLQINLDEYEKLVAEQLSSGGSGGGIGGLISNAADFAEDNAICIELITCFFVVIAARFFRALCSSCYNGRR